MVCIVTFLCYFYEGNLFLFFFLYRHFNGNLFDSNYIKWQKNRSEIKMKIEEEEHDNLFNNLNFRDHINNLYKIKNDYLQPNSDIQ